MMRETVCIVGPTCTGKSSLAVAVALELNGEIISADSMQVYRGLDVGTAKLPFEERRGVPHHLIDCCEPHETFSAGDFQARADRLLRETAERGRLPLIVGGTGLYLRALLLGLAPVGPANREVRERLRRRAELKGMKAMHRLLRRLDPPSAAKLPPGDSQRILRALEYRVATGRKLSEAVARRPFGKERYKTLKIGLEISRPELRRRIESRVEEMMAHGWIDEVKRLLDAGVSPDAHAFTAIGYKEIISYIRNKEVTLEETMEDIKNVTRQYAKRQETWFRREKGIIWVDANPPQAAHKVVLNLINSQEAGRAGNR